MTTDTPFPANAHIENCRVTYRMSDQMGVVYYGNYLEMFEMGRSGLLRSTGFSYRQMEQEGYQLPVIHAALDYLSPARYDDLLDIHTWIARLTRVRVDFHYQITLNGQSQVLCKGSTHHAIIGPDGRPRRLSPEWMERLELLTARA